MDQVTGRKVCSCGAVLGARRSPGQDGHHGQFGKKQTYLPFSLLESSRSFRAGRKRWRAGQLSGIAVLTEDLEEDSVDEDSHWAGFGPG